MAKTPQLAIIYGTDHSSVVSASVLATLQSNVQNFGNQYLPLIGGVLSGPIRFSPGQLFQSSSVAVTDPPYLHAGLWQTLADHIADATVHQASALPIVHGFTHELGGGDPLYGDSILISASLSTQTIKNYIDASVAAVENEAVYAPGTWYSIGGGDPLYGSLIAIAAASGTVSIKAYIDSSIATSIAGGYSSNPTFQTVAINGTGGLIQWTTSNLLLQDKGGATSLSSDGTNLALRTTLGGGVINLGNQTSQNAYGTLGANGYSIGSTTIGPNGGSINGSLSLTGDLTLSRSSYLANASAGNIFFSGANLSYNADIASQFYLSTSTTIGGGLSLPNGYSILLKNTLQIGVLGNTSSQPGVYSDGTNLGLYALESGNINLGYPNTNLGSISFGPAGRWGSLTSVGLTIGTSLYAASALSVEGPGSFSGAWIGSAGDVGVARTTNSGLIGFGRTPAGTFDWGVTANSTFSFAGSALLSQILPSGAYSVGSSIYGPVGATVSGTVKSQGYTSTASLGFGGPGYSFAGLAQNDTGMFSSGGTDLRFYCGSTNLALWFQNSGTVASFGGAVIVPGALSSATLAVSGNASFSGTTSFPGPVLGGGNSISKWRIKGYLDLGYSGSAAATATVYKNQVVPTYNSATIDRLWLSCVTPDSTTPNTQFTIYKNGTPIGQATFTTGAYTTSAFPTVNPTSVSPGDQLQAKCTQAGTAVGIAVTLEISQAIY